MLRRIAALALPDGWQNRKERQSGCLEVIQGGQVLAARQVGGGEQARKVRVTAKTSREATQKRAWRSEFEPMGQWV